MVWNPDEERKRAGTAYYNGYSAPHPVGLEVRADMLESVEAYPADVFKRELEYALNDLRLEDAGSIRWLCALLTRKVNDLEGR